MQQPGWVRSPGVRNLEPFMDGVERLGAERGGAAALGPRTRQRSATSPEDGTGEREQEQQAEHTHLEENPSPPQQGNVQGREGQGHGQAGQGQGQEEGAGPAGQQDASKFNRAWEEVWDCAAGNRAKVCLWRAMHACLPTGLYTAAHGRNSHRPYPQLCPAPTCQAGRPQDRPRDSLSHLLLHCPLYQPARVWLQQLWAAVVGPDTPAPPMDDAGVMLAGCGWGPEPEKRPSGLWHTLRALFVHAIWCAHHSRDPARQTAHAVAVQVVEEARRLMCCQWAMAAQLEEVVDALPSRLLTAQVKAHERAKEDFMMTWAVNEVLCAIVTRPGISGSFLDLRLTAEQPIPVPVEAAAAGAEAGGSSS